MDIYDRINLLLTEKKTNKRKMCLDLNMPYSTIASMFARRSENVDINVMKKIASYLGTTLEYLVFGNEQHRFANDNDYYNSSTIVVIKSKDDKKYYKLNEQNFNAIVTILKQFDK